MTIYGWDASNHDWSRGSMDIAAARKSGISFMTHKVGEGGGYVDPKFKQFYGRAKQAGVPLLGGYYVNHPGNQVMQADHFLRLLDQSAPGWRNGPFILQIDAEKFEYMSRAPSLAEIRQFAARLREKAPAHVPVVYAPKWLYGDKLRGLGLPLWSSNYGSNARGAYRSLYPGDKGPGWGAYSGITPAIWQYGSRTTIGVQHTCDANAFRGTLADLQTLVYPPQRGHGEVELTDRLKLVTGKGVDYSSKDGTISVQGVLASTNYYVLKRAAEILSKLSGLEAQNRAILAAVTDDADRDAILAAIAERGAQDGEKFLAIIDLIRKGDSGELAAHEALRLIGEAIGNIADLPNDTSAPVSPSGSDAHPA